MAGGFVGCCRIPVTTGTKRVLDVAFGLHISGSECQRRAGRLGYFKHQDIWNILRFGVLEATIVAHHGLYYLTPITATVFSKIRNGRLRELATVPISLLGHDEER
jgi:hypothetical protein